MKLQQLDAYPSEDGALQLRIPFEASSLSLKLNLASQTLGALASQVRQINTSIKKVHFYTLDGATIPECELLRDRDNIPFIMSVSRDENVKHNFSINLNQGFSIATGVHRSKESEEAYLDYCLGIGLPKYSSFLLSNFASKLHQSLPKGDTVSNQAIIESLRHTLSYFRPVVNKSAHLSVSEVERQIEERQAELLRLNQQR